MSGSFGKTWWGEKWLQSLNNIDFSNRLPRGASYARKGAVEKITITGNHISAKVKGSRPRPYKVDIIMPPFFDPELENFLRDLTRQPVIISRLLNRELDPSLLDLAMKHGLKVFPRQWSDLKMQCSCPDWAVPCKHLAAVIYKVSSEIDNNPFQVFTIHNVDLLRRLDQLGIVIHKENMEIPGIKELCLEKKKSATKFDPENAYNKLSFTGLQSLHEPLTALLSPSPAFYTTSETDFREKYRALLTRVVKNTQKAAKGKIALEEFFSGASKTEQQINPYSELTIVLNDQFRAQVWIDDLKYTIPELLLQLSRIHSSRIYDYQPSTAALHTALHLSLQLVAHGAIVPQIVRLTGKAYIVRWLPAMISSDVKKLVDELENILLPDLCYWQEGEKLTVINREPALNLLSLFITEIVRIVSYRVEDNLFESLFFKSAAYPFNLPGEESLPGGIQVWLQKYYLTQGRFKPMLLVEETRDNRFIVQVNIQDRNHPNEASTPLQTILKDEQYGNERFEILQSLTQLSAFISGLDTYINAGGKEDLIMTNEVFTRFLMEMIPAIQLLNISVLLPISLQEILRPKASVKLKSKPSARGFLRLDKLLDFDWQIAIGDTLLPPEEFEKLLKRSEGLIRFKKRYIYVEKEDLEKIHRHLSQPGEISAFQMLRAALSGEYQGAPVSMTDEVKEMVSELINVGEVKLPEGLQALMRPYQHRGFSWIYRNAQIGFGSVLADDMGLGKTLQVIATILKFKEERVLEKEKVLVVAPTGLLTNWQAEIQKFAPSLLTEIYHGATRDLKRLSEVDILITSYGMARRDADQFKKMKWHTLVIDEAQNIKNQETQQTKAIKSIKAGNCIALSGTPVENRLSELWSIMDFSNRGFLGSLKEFQDTWAQPIEQLNDRETANKLKKVTAPFMMRRLKTDKNIISDLPDKIEIDSYASLTSVQAGLYEKTLDEAMDAIEGVSGTDQKALFVRQGLVLQMILALKQICNHPAQFLKNGETDASLSGKVELLFDKLDSITESNEKVLLFTQFTQMGDLLRHFITERYHNEPLYIHGGCSIDQRKEMVERFQTNHADRIFLLSLKAAGTGLNLTAASHVIHYDLWWNPAVEAQATDRAYRIGQKNNVMVHRFITRNTFEEKINEMIRKKKALAEMTVATGESWIGNLSNKELREIFTPGEK